MDEHTLNDLLECSVCLERLDTSSKVLPCQHTFCRKCLEVIVASHQELRCPECRVLVDSKIDDLPPNVLLMRILEGMKSAQAAAKSQQSEQSSATVTDNNNKNSGDKATITTTLIINQLQEKSSSTTSNGPGASTSPATTTAVPSSSTRRCPLPHAYALYDFKSSEASDLQFKKGDLILLKRRLDINWFVGQSNGKEGTFPVNYVKVIVPLPTPQCLALYDFKMGPNEEEGCLSFKKGAVIQVLRRVDENWAEGCIGSTIGIFPIAFVEMNTMAKKLLDKSQKATSRSMGAIADSVRDQAPQQLQQPAPPKMRRQQMALPSMPVPLLDPFSNIAGSSSDSTPSNSLTSPTTTSNSSSNASSPPQSLPNTPQRALALTTTTGGGSVRFRDHRDKRHSLNAIFSSGFNIKGEVASLSVLQTNRHSAEILSMPSEIEGAGIGGAGGLGGGARTPEGDKGNNSERSMEGGSRRVNVLKTSPQSGPPPLPWGYLALYPYKPRKADELELKKGCVYIVTERCLDGWFKGKNWQDISGVFPGNYVAPLRLRDQQQLMHQWKYVPLQQTSPTAGSTVATVGLGCVDGQVNRMPELPPRQSKPQPAEEQNSGRDSPISIMSANTTTTCSSVWTKPLGHTMDVLFHRSNKDKDSKPTPSYTTSPPPPSSTSAAVSLMKRLANIKSSSRAKSPNLTQVSAEAVTLNPLTSTASLQTMHPVHVRSGSCPSQLLQALPSNNTEQCGPPPSYGSGGSQQLKDSKNRTSIICARKSTDSNAFHDIYNHQQQQQQAEQIMQYPMGGGIYKKCGQQQSMGLPPSSSLIANEGLVYHHCKSQSMDASGVLTAGVSVVPNNPPVAVTAAAISASATTKSLGGRESRFRCVVPYPPNSDIELELHVGDIIYVHRKQKNGWYKGTHARTQKTGLFPASFVEPIDP